MKPVFLAEGSNKIFGVYQSPEKPGKNARCVIICSPVAHEYIKSYRMIRVLADRISHSGSHVLRFDWFGHGDSSGTFGNGNFMIWGKNISTAVDFLLSQAGNCPLYIVGFRLGASILIKQSPLISNHHEIVLCDPVLDGSSWINSIQSIHKKLFPDVLKVCSDNSRELIGFHYSPNLLNDISHFNINTRYTDNKKYDLICSNFERNKNESFFLNHGTFFKSVNFTDDPDIWGKPEWFDRIILNSQALNIITSQITGISQ